MIGPSVQTRAAFRWRLAHVDTIGIALGLLAAALYASGVLVQKVALKTTDALGATWVGCAVGAIALAPFLPQLVTEVAVAPIPATLAMVYLGVFPSAIAFVLWAYVLQRSTAGATASATLAVPAIVVLMSWLILGELPTILGMIGGVVCLAGVASSRLGGGGDEYERSGEAGRDECLLEHGSSSLRNLHNELSPDSTQS